MTTTPATFDVVVAGRSWTIERAALDDFELLADFGAIEAGNAARVPIALQRMLGPAQTREAIASLRDPDTGRVSIEAGADFFKTLLEGLKAGNPAAS